MKVLNGNDLMRTHPQVWFKCFEALKNHFMKHVGQEARNHGFYDDLDGFFFQEPVSVEIEMRAPFGAANWDIDGMWFYHKCLLDAMRDLKLIRNDNIIHVREAGKTRFIPCIKDETPEMTITIQEIETDFTFMINQMHIVESRELTPGEIRAELRPAFSLEKGLLLIGVGRKKIIYGKAKTAIKRALQYCLDNLQSATVSAETYATYIKFFECFEEHRVPLKIKQSE